jgi:TolB-like protein
LAEEIINALANVPAWCDRSYLRVRIQGKQVDVRRIAEVWVAANVLEGSVRKVAIAFASRQR